MFMKEYLKVELIKFRKELIVLRKEVIEIKIVL